MSSCALELPPQSLAVQALLNLNGGSATSESEDSTDEDTCRVGTPQHTQASDSPHVSPSPQGSRHWERASPTPPYRDELLDAVADDVQVCRAGVRVRRGCRPPRHL